MSGCSTANSAKCADGAKTAEKQYQPAVVAVTGAELAVKLGGVAAVCLVSAAVPICVPVAVEQVFGPLVAVKHS
jgi:hypothetical protein